MSDDEFEAKLAGELAPSEEEGSSNSSLSPAEIERAESLELASKCH
jgi:hypothetical protein